MASITQVKGKWRALIRRKGFPPQCRTFRVKAQADRWAREIEAEMDAGRSPLLVSRVTVGAVIEAYRAMRERSRPIADDSTEHYMLKTLDRLLGSKLLGAITPDDMVTFATTRRSEGAGGYTINMDVSKLGTVLRFGGAALGITPPDIAGAARPLLTHLRLIHGGGKRERRPTEDELRRVLEHLAERRGPPYDDATAFAAASAMRLNEVCSIRKPEIDTTKRVVPVWRKHPRKGKTLEQVPLVMGSYEIAMRQPDSHDGRVFPIHPRTVSKYFTEACKALSIPDLHFHDLRHEGTSRLFEAGYDIPRASLVTGHKSWGNLRRYTNLRPEDAHEPSARENPTR